MILEKTTKAAGRAMPYTTEFVVGIGVFTRSTVEVPGRFRQPTEGDLTLVRVWDNGDVIALGDGVQWFDTVANPRIALPRSIGFVGLALGIGVGFLLAALALRRSTGGWIRPKEAVTRAIPLWTSASVVFLVPLPAFLAAVLWFGQPVWMPLALDAGAAAVGVAGVLLARRVRSVQLAEVDSSAPDASSGDGFDPYRWPMS